MTASAISALALAACVNAAVTRDTVKYNGSGKLEYDTNNRYALVYYDCGNSSPFNNARLYAKAESKSSGNAPFLFVELYYADHESNDFTTKSKNNQGYYDSIKSEELEYNPWNVDYLQPDSYANAQYGAVADYYLTVVQ